MQERIERIERGGMPFGEQRHAALKQGRPQGQLAKHQSARNLRANRQVAPQNIAFGKNALRECDRQMVHQKPRAQREHRPEVIPLE